MIRGQIAGDAAQFPQPGPRSLVSRIELQHVGQMGHGFLWVIHYFRSFQPGFGTGRIYLQRRGKETPCAGALPGSCGFTTPSHKLRTLLIKGCRLGLLASQWILPFLVAQTDCWRYYHKKCFLTTICKLS